MLRCPPALALLTLVLVAVGCSQGEEGRLETRGDAMESNPQESVRPGPTAGITGGGEGVSDASRAAVADDMGQVGAVFPNTEQPTGKAPRATQGWLRDTSHLDPDTAEYRRHGGEAGHG